MGEYTHEQVVTELVLGGDMPVSELRDLAAKHMRELQALNAELVAALKKADEGFNALFGPDAKPGPVVQQVRAAIKKAESQ